MFWSIVLNVGISPFFVVKSKDFSTKIFNSLSIFFKSVLLSSRLSCEKFKAAFKQTSLRTVAMSRLIF